MHVLNQSIKMLVEEEQVKIILYKKLKTHLIYYRGSYNFSLNLQDAIVFSDYQLAVDHADFLNKITNGINKVKVQVGFLIESTYSRQD